MLPKIFLRVEPCFCGSDPGVFINNDFLSGVLPRDEVSFFIYLSIAPFLLASPTKNYRFSSPGSRYLSAT